MTTTHGDADFTVEHELDRVRITIIQQGQRARITLPATSAMQLSRAITRQAALAMTEEA
jgi:hypothetical protein